MYRRALLIASLFGILGLLASGCASSPQKKPIDQEATNKYSTLMEEAADNPHENGCVSCHRKTEEVDRSLPAYVERIEGHPSVKQGTVSACYECHEAEKDYNLYKKFYKGIHNSHWLSDSFYKQADGRCYSCHTVEKSGVSGIKDYPLAGYRTLTGNAAPPQVKTAPEPAQEKQKPKEQPKPEEQPRETEQQEETETPPAEEQVEQQPTPGP